MTRQNADADLGRSLGPRLLADVRDVFDALPTVSFLSSAELVRRLRDVDDGPWHELDLTTRRLAARLSGYRIRPGHNTAKTERGYQLGWFTDAFSRYLPESGLDPSERPEPPETLGFSTDAYPATDGSIRPPSADPSVETPQNHWPSDARTLPDAPPAAREPRRFTRNVSGGPRMTHPTEDDDNERATR